MELRHVDVDGFTLTLMRPCRCYESKHLMRGVWLGSTETFTGRRQGQWTFWRYTGGTYVRSSAIFRTSVPRAALGLFRALRPGVDRYGQPRKPGSFKLVHLDDWHVLGAKPQRRK